MRLQDGEEALALLHVPRERIEMFRPLVPGSAAHFGLRLARGGDGGVDVGGQSLA